MKALTIWQPYASLLMIKGVKQYETRGWAPPAKLIGQRVAIHAASRKIKPLDVPPWIVEDMEPYLGRQEKWHDNLAFGAILGTATLAMAGKVAPESGDVQLTWSEVVGPKDSDGAFLSMATGEYLFGDYRPGRWLWRFVDHEVFPEPIPAKGQQGLWDWKP